MAAIAIMYSDIVCRYVQFRASTSWNPDHSVRMAPLDEVALMQCVRGLTRFGPDGSVNAGLLKAGKSPRMDRLYLQSLHEGGPSMTALTMDAEDVRIQPRPAPRRGFSEMPQKALVLPG